MGLTDTTETNASSVTLMRPIDTYEISRTFKLMSNLFEALKVQQKELFFK